MVERLDSLIAAVGPLGYLVLGLSALLEYVVPPFPGDTVVLLGGVYAVRGQKPWALVLAVVTLGSVLGAAVDYYLGLRLARRMERQPQFGLRHPHLARLQERMRRRGMLLIAFNRFMPGVRPLLFVAAGGAGMPFRRVMAWGAFSAALWNSLIMAVGYALGGNAERLEVLVSRYNEAAWLALGAVVLVVGVRFLWKALRRPSKEP
jgi:membrane protein DedA with SNARE-associated domain